MGPSAIHESGHFYFAQTGHSHFAATDNIFVDAVLDVRCTILPAKQLSSVRLILGEKKFRFSFAEEPALSVSLVLDLDHS
jgi:hypothetical protein